MITVEKDILECLQTIDNDISWEMKENPRQKAPDLDSYAQMQFLGF